MMMMNFLMNKRKKAKEKTNYKQKHHYSRQYKEMECTGSSLVPYKPNFFLFFSPPVCAGL